MISTIYSKKNPRESKVVWSRLLDLEKVDNPKGCE